MYAVLKQIQHSVHSDKNESESLDFSRGLGIGTEIGERHGANRESLSERYCAIRERLG